MSRQLSHNARYAEVGVKRTIKADQLNDGATMNAGNEVTVWSKQVPADKYYAWGAGTNNRVQGREAHIHADFVDDADNDIEGDLVAVITDSEQRRVVAEYELGDLGTLADAADDDRTERPLMPVLAPLAREDRHLELRINADSDSDGVDLDRDASDVRLYYTDIGN